MKFVLAPDSFKESMTAEEVCSSMEKGIKKVFIDARCIHMPMADGGEGTLDTLINATNGKTIKEYVTGPLGERIESRFGILGSGDTAVIEMAEACGLQLVDTAQRNPLITTSYGVGELIVKALDFGVKNILTGPNGASYIFGPQKGATESMVKILDNNLKHYSNIVRSIFNIDLESIEGGGAGGGAASALLGFCNGSFKSGIDIVMNYSKLDEKIKESDYVFTGEGSIDFQTKEGKTMTGIINIAKKYNVPVIALGGKVNFDVKEFYNYSKLSMFSILSEVTSIEEALKGGKYNVEKTCENISILIKCIK
ncbi:glycerate kinase [Clostridium bornimense]|uniref:glycerate kinase family protein n=1 Tax=Clostridium bornimense TaxID=1216932 RepID=UPI001C0FDB64|nr:glycerate kinase [Clostridium bornimense]MBU5315374.1 glycerate kinase [Clostridium bornimense]